MNLLDTERCVEASRAAGLQAWRMAEGRLDVVVPACPDWKIRDVVYHLGNIASFIGACLEQGAGEPEFTDAEMFPDGKLLAWAADEWDGVLDRLSAAAPLAPAWNWSTQPYVASFWPRCLTHVAFIHTWDVAGAVGAELTIPAEVAADGVDEVFTVHLPAGVRDGRRFTVSGRAEVQSIDTDNRWLVETSSDTVRARVAGPGEPHDIRLEASAEALYLDLWGRERLGLHSLDRQWADQLAACTPAG
jgi:uncharacterized protein (TIGR03083 family)